MSYDDSTYSEGRRGRRRPRHGRHGLWGSADEFATGRKFEAVDLQLVILAFLAERPAHGYELIKAIEERLGGRYSPSPGIVYPTLTLLEEMGYVSVDTADGGGRKRYSVTDAGREFLAANRATTDEMMARMDGGVAGAGPRAGRPPQIVRAIENLKLAMRLRLAREPLTEQQAHEFAAVLDSAAQQLERI